jgi:hypothetical protein
MQNAYLALEGEAAKVGLRINEEKIRYIIAARNDRTIRDVGQKFFFNRPLPDIGCSAT